MYRRKTEEYSFNFYRKTLLNINTFSKKQMTLPPNKLDYIKLKFAFIKKNPIRVKRKATNWENIFIIHIINKRAKIFKGVLRMDKKIKANKGHYTYMNI